MFSSSTMPASSSSLVSYHIEQERKGISEIQSRWKEEDEEDEEEGEEGEEEEEEKGPRLFYGCRPTLSK